MKKRKYNLNENYFEEINNEEKAYFLGLVASDGCITDEHKLLISLQERDSYILERFKDSILYQGPLYSIKAYKEGHQSQKRIQFKSEKISNDLNNLGIYPRKSLNLKFPELCYSIINHFIRGYFDGDGCMRMSKGVLNYKFVGTFEFLDKLQNILIKNCNLEKIKMYQANKDKNTWELSYGGDRQCIRIYGFLYNNASIFLNRKKEKARVEISDSLKFYPSNVLLEELKIREFIPHFIN